MKNPAYFHRQSVTYLHAIAIINNNAAHVDDEEDDDDCDDD